MNYERSVFSYVNIFSLNFLQIFDLETETVFDPQGRPSPFLQVKLQITGFRSQNLKFFFSDIQHENKPRSIRK
jgi:hypothetical protein